MSDKIYLEKIVSAEFLDGGETLFKTLRNGPQKGVYLLLNKFEISLGSKVAIKVISSKYNLFSQSYTGEVSVVYHMEIYDSLGENKIEDYLAEYKTKQRAVQ